MVPGASKIWPTATAVHFKTLAEMVETFSITIYFVEIYNIELKVIVDSCKQIAGNIIFIEDNNNTEIIYWHTHIDRI